VGEPLELIAFDFDGTLADTRPAIAETLSLTLRHFGRPPLDEREVVSRIGRPLRETLAAAGLRGWQLPAAERFYRSRYGEIAERHTKLYPGAAAALDVLAQAGVRLAVASSKGREALRESLAALGVAERLEVVIGAEDAERPKPDPEPVSRVLERTGGPPERTLVVGDTVHDVIRFIEPEVTMIGTGWVASAAALIFIAVERERRLALPNTRFLLHQPLGSAQGPMADLAIEAEQIVAIRERLNRRFAEATGQPVDKIERETRRNLWMNATEALEYGLVGRIVDRIEDV